MRRIPLPAVLVAMAAPASAETVIWTGEVHVEKWATDDGSRSLLAGAASIPRPLSSSRSGDGGVVGVTIQGADTGDTTTMVETVIAAAEQVEAVLPTASGMAEVVAHKGYHSNETMVDLAAVGVRSYIAEPDRGRRCWKGAPEARDAVYANRRRIRGNRGRELLRRRGALLERPFAHLYDTGGMRRVHLRGHSNILKRGAGPCRGWQPRAASASSDRRRHAPVASRGGSCRLYGRCSDGWSARGPVWSGSWRRFRQICRPQPATALVRPSSPPF